jgi:Rrf2 family iron-sulfur cluster assembly transcriptional regulator
MALLPRKSILAIAAVTDVALHCGERPVSAKALAERGGLAPRHLETVLQALVRHGILKGIRGPRGGYELARERSRITADEIIRAAATAEDTDEPELPPSSVLERAVIPALAEAEQSFVQALARISIDDMIRRAKMAARSDRSPKKAQSSL